MVMMRRMFAPESHDNLSFGAIDDGALVEKRKMENGLHDDGDGGGGDW